MRALLAPLPFACLAVGVLGFHRLGLDWRRSTLAAAIAWAVWLTALTETLGAARLLTVAAVASAWVAATVVSAFILTRVRPADPPPPNPSPPAPSKAVLWALGLAVALVGVAALAGAPTNWDALSYHLPRVMHWIQNASVDHYPTHILRQLHQAPWSEFAVMHLQLLSGGDRLANTIQWLALLGTAVGVSVVAEQLGGGPPAQLLSAVFY
ncbi:MAG TPA: 4-amino-4-deoxy-L-arabinose transferase, partial [Vicinamibacteria bacterium]